MAPKKSLKKVVRKRRERKVVERGAAHIRSSFKTLDATALGRTAAIVRNGGDVLDHAHIQTGGLQGADGSLTAGAGALDEDFNRLQAVFHSGLGGSLGSQLSGEGRGLLGATEAQDRALPCVSVMVTIVLLKEERIWAAPRSTSLRSRRLRVTFLSFCCLGAIESSLRAPFRGVNHMRRVNYLPAFFLPAMVFLGPLRVRAFCLVF